MQQAPLILSRLIVHAARHHGDTAIVSRASTGTVRTTYARVEARARRLARALARLGARPGERVATLAWNDHRHLELYYGTSGAGFVCHTINPRLFFEQIVFILGHAEDVVVMFDPDFGDLVTRLRPLAPGVRAWVALCGPEGLPALGLPGALSYEALLAAEDDDYAWPALDEGEAASLCYTSGTTGEPKGVLYAHRSTVLHSMAAVAPDNFDLSARDVVMPASSMYHANAWGLPHAATLCGASLVLPGRALDGRSLAELVVAEGVTRSSGVPTVWLGVLRHLEATGGGLPSLERLVVAGSACPPALITAMRARHGVAVTQMWGMTETSPLGVMNLPKARHADLDVAAADELAAAQGRPPFGVDIAILGPDGVALPHDGNAIGDFCVRGDWVTKAYYQGGGSALDDDGWFSTGDVATIDPDGYVRITDRSKDLIKSGGEWISSIELEGAAQDHPDVVEAAVVGVPHPKWDERPLLVVVAKPGTAPTVADLRAFMRGRVASWAVPDDVLFVDEIPHTATGKIAKRELRARHAEHYAGAAG